MASSRLVMHFPIQFKGLLYIPVNITSLHHGDSYRSRAQRNNYNVNGFNKKTDEVIPIMSSKKHTSQRYNTTQKPQTTISTTTTSHLTNLFNACIYLCEAKDNKTSWTRFIHVNVGQWETMMMMARSYKYKKKGFCKE